MARSTGAGSTGAPTSRSARTAPVTDRVVRRRAAESETQSAEEPTSSAAVLAEPQISAPRVRLGVLWFFLAMAAVTSGRWWSAVFMAATAAIASMQTTLVWVRSMEPEAPVPRSLGPGLLAASGSAFVTLAAGYSTGLAGAVFIVAGLLVGVVALKARRRDGDGPVPASVIPIAMFLPAFAAVSVVLAVRLDLWAGLFLVLAVSLYDAGSYLLGAEASGRWEGPVAGIIGALAVTFTVSTVQFGPFDRIEWWLLGMVVAASSVVGQSVSSALLPRADVEVAGLRRLDAYVVAGPLFVAGCWLLS